MMLKTVSSLALVLGLSLGTGAWAQSAETEAPADAAETTEAETGVAADLDLGEDASEPEVGQSYTKETIGAWELRCVRVAEGEEPCQMYQLMSDSEGTPVAEVSLFKLPTGGKAKAGATVIVPLETALQRQLTISIDGGSARRYPYSFCNPIGCYARIGLTEEDVNGYKRGNGAKLTIIPVVAPDQKVELDMSLDGFTATYEKVSILAQ